jgi:hypothetical protein
MFLCSESFQRCRLLGVRSSTLTETYAIVVWSLQCLVSLFSWKNVDSRKGVVGGSKGVDDGKKGAFDNRRNLVDSKRNLFGSKRAFVVSGTDLDMEKGSW